MEVITLNPKTAMKEPSFQVCLFFIKFGYKEFFLSPQPIKVPIAANYEGVCLQNTSKSNSYHPNIMAFFMTLWTGNGAVLKSSSPWQLKEF